MDKQALVQSIINLIEPITNFNGAELVRVKIIGTLSKPTIQIMAERPNMTMDLGLCEALSREYSLLLDVEDIISGEYVLEVSSPGIDRPLTRHKDFVRWQGHQISIDLAEKHNNRRRLKGKLLAPSNMTEPNIFTITVEEETGCFDVPFDKIAEAKLVLTDELLAETKNGKTLHGFAYDDDHADILSNVDIEIDDKDKIKKMARKKRPKKIEEIEEVITLDTETKGN